MTLVGEFKKLLEKYDGELYEEYKGIDLDVDDAPWSRSQKDRYLSRMSDYKEFLLQLMEANSNVIDLIEEWEEA